MRATSPPQSHLSPSPRRTILSIVIVIVLALGLLPAFAGAAVAQDAPAAQEPAGPATPASSSTWTLKPATPDGPDSRAHYVYDVTPGQTISDTAAVTNFSDVALHLNVYASDAFTTAAGGYDLLASREQPVDVGSWITVGTMVLDLAPKQTALIPVTITVPGNATPGDHSGGIVAALVTAATGASGQQVAVENRVGARVYLRVDGPLVPRLDVVDFTANYQDTLNPVGAGRVDAHYKVVNAGNVRLSGGQTVTVTGPFGSELGSRRLDDLPELLPGASIEVDARLDDIWPAGRLTTTVGLEPVDPKGSAGTEPISVSTAQWAIPWSQLVLLLLIVGGFVGLVAKRRRTPRGPAPTARTFDPLTAIVPDEAPTPAAAGSGTAGTDPHSS